MLSRTQRGRDEVGDLRHAVRILRSAVSERDKVIATLKSSERWNALMEAKASAAASTQEVVHLRLAVAEADAQRHCAEHAATAANESSQETKRQLDDALDENIRLRASSAALRWACHATESALHAVLDPPPKPGDVVDIIQPPNGQGGERVTGTVVAHRVTHDNSWRFDVRRDPDGGVEHEVLRAQLRWRPSGSDELADTRAAALLRVVESLRDELAELKEAQMERQIRSAVAL